MKPSWKKIIPTASIVFLKIIFGSEHYYSVLFADPVEI